MGIDNGLSINRAVHLYSEIVTHDLKEKKANRLQKELAPQQREVLFPQDKITLSSQKPEDVASNNKKTVTTKYYLGSAQEKRIIDIYA